MTSSPLVLEAKTKSDFESVEPSCDSVRNYCEAVSAAVARYLRVIPPQRQWRDRAIRKDVGGKTDHCNFREVFADCTMQLMTHPQLEQAVVESIADSYYQAA